MSNENSTVKAVQVGSIFSAPSGRVDSLVVSKKGVIYVKGQQKKKRK